jgi:hypothetical protein
MGRLARGGAKWTSLTRTGRCKCGEDEATVRRCGKLRRTGLRLDDAPTEEFCRMEDSDSHSGSHNNS